MLTNLETQRRALHRRDPPPVAGGRGDPLPGAGGLPDRHHDRRGPGGALDQARPAAVHAGRRDHARRHADQPAARPLRHRRAAGVLHAEELARIVHALGRAARRADRRRRRASRSRAARAARRASPTACCAACATTPTSRATGRITQAIADQALAMLDVDPQGFDVMDRKLLEAVIHRFDGGPVGPGQRRRGDRRGARHDRGRDRALPDPAGLPAAHAARAHRHAGGVPPPGRGAAEKRGRAVRRLLSCHL